MELKTDFWREAYANIYKIFQPLSKIRNEDLLDDSLKFKTEDYSTLYRKESPTFTLNMHYVKLKPKKKRLKPNFRQEENQTSPSGVTNSVSPLPFIGRKNNSSNPTPIGFSQKNPRKNLKHAFLVNGLKVCSNLPTSRFKNPEEKLPKNASFLASLRNKVIQEYSEVFKQLDPTNTHKIKKENFIEFLEKRDIARDCFRIKSPNQTKKPKPKSNSPSKILGTQHIHLPTKFDLLEISEETMKKADQLMELFDPLNTSEISEEMFYSVLTLYHWYFTEKSLINSAANIKRISKIKRLQPVLDKLKKVFLSYSDGNCIKKSKSKKIFPDIPPKLLYFPEFLNLSPIYLNRNL